MALKVGRGFYAEFRAVGGTILNPTTVSNE